MKIITNKKLLFESGIVVLILSILCAVMVPRFFENQELARIKKNEGELKEMLEAIQQPGHAFRKYLFQMIQKFPNNPMNHYIGEAPGIAAHFPDDQYDFQLEQGEFLMIVYLGMDHIVKPDELSMDMDVPIGVFVVRNRESEKDIQTYFNSHWIDSTYVYFEPKPDYYFAPSNGMNSEGMIYFDNQGRSWRDE